VPCTIEPLNLHYTTTHTNTHTCTCTHACMHAGDFSAVHEHHCCAELVCVARAPTCTPCAHLQGSTVLLQSCDALISGRTWRRGRGGKCSRGEMPAASMCMHLSLNDPDKSLMASTSRVKHLHAQYLCLQFLQEHKIPSCKGA